MAADDGRRVTFPGFRAAGKLVASMQEPLEVRLAQRWQSLFSSDRFRKNLQLLCALSLLGWMLFTWGQLGILVVRDYVNLPVWDYWRVVQNYEQYRAHDFRVLWVQHNEHRIVFPELVYAVDMLYLQGRQILPLVLSGLCYLGNWAVLAWAFIPTRRGDGFARTISVLTAGLVIGSQASSQLLNTPFLLQWTLVQLAALLGFLFVSRLGETSSRLYLAAAVVCVVVANYSSGNGLLLWPIVLLAAFAAGVRWVDLALLGGAALLSIGLYFVGYHFSKDSNPLAILQNPLYALGFLSSYLSMPFGYQVPAAGLLNLVAFAILAVVVLRRRLWRARPVIVCFGFYLFTLATIFITMAGRMNPADPDYIAAMAPRYVTVPLVNWAVLLLAALWISLRLDWDFLSWWKIAAAGLVLFQFTSMRVHFWVAQEELNVVQQQASALSIESGILAPELIRKIFPDPNFVAVRLPILQRNHLSLFSEPWASWVGKDAAYNLRLAPLEFASGAVDKIRPISGGLQISGWVESAKNYRRLVILNESNQVVGLGKRNSAGIAPALRPAGKRARLAWIGFIDDRLPSSRYRVFLVDDAAPRPALSPLGAGFGQPAVTLQDVLLPGTVLAPFSWQEHSGWLENAIPPQVEAGDAHSPSFLSSWSGSDQSTGVASSSLFAVPNGCFVLPVLHGPTIEHQAVRLFDQDGKSFATIPLDPNNTTWTLFRITTTAAQARILAEDAGSSFGEWQAVGLPRTCQSK